MARLSPGDPLPWLSCRTARSPSFPLSALAGRTSVITYIGSAGHAATRAVVAGFRARPDLFDGECAVHLTASCDARDEAQTRLVDSPPGFLLLWDFDQKLARGLGVFERDPRGGTTSLKPVSFVIDASLRVVAAFPIVDPVRHALEVNSWLESALSSPPAEASAASGGFAPVLIIPRVLEPELCRTLIETFEAGKPEESGLMRNVAGTQGSLVVDYARKRRRDLQIEDPALLEAVHSRVERRVVPEVKKAFQFGITRVERYVIACYDAETGGHFSAHRDDTGPATAHRKFACTINLNTGEYEGGELSFAEYGTTRYRPPAGGAVVFSCSLLHEAHPVTRGRRYCLIPFLYDEDGERRRQEFLSSRIDPALRRAFGDVVNHRVRSG